MTDPIDSAEIFADRWLSKAGRKVFTATQADERAEEKEARQDQQRKAAIAADKAEQNEFLAKIGEIDVVEQAAVFAKIDAADKTKPDDVELATFMALKRRDRDDTQN